MYSSQRGFTLIEILIAISLIGILLSVTISASITLQKSSRDARRKSDLRSIQSALQQYYADQFNFPTAINGSVSFSSGAVQKTYLGNIPQDPSTRTNYGFLAIKCDNTGGNCQGYCLYAKLEFQKPEVTNLPTDCTTDSTLNSTYPRATSEIVSNL